ncbi:MAG: hypothetical protein U0324_33625 [Polyangiales bacterium]
MRRPLPTVFALALAALSCKKNPPPAPRPAADAATADAAAVIDDSPLVAPEGAVFTLRGSGVRKLLNVVAPGAPTRLALGQVAPQFSPGIGEHGVDVDPDAPFAAVATARGEEPGKLALVIAWPLRSGMQVAQDAQAGRGYREVMANIYESTAAPEPGDAGAQAARNPCWVARKQPVGWMLVCGPTEALRASARFLVRAGARPPDGDPVVDLTFRPEAARPLLALQVAALEAHDPARSDAGTAAERAAVQAQYDAVHRSALTYKEVVDDLRSLHARLTIDDAAYHLRAEAEFANATGANTRALLASTVGRRTALELLGRLPSTVNSYLGLSVDGSALGPLAGGGDDDDPRVAAAMGPEFVRFQHALRDLSGLRRAGERAVGFMTGNGGTKIEVLRIADAATTLQQVRTAALAVPRTPRPSGMNPADQFAVLPTPPAMPPGTLRLRLGPDPARLPPNAPAEMRRAYSRSTALVPEGDKVYLIDAQDPVATWTALQQGQRLTVTVPEDRAGVIHLNPMAVLMLLGVPASEDIARQAGGEPIDGTLTARRAGDAGGRFELQVDAPVQSVNQVRDVVAAIQAQQAQMMQQQQAQMEQMQRQMQAQARRAPQGPQRPQLPQLPVPESPDQLPDPNFQLRGPGR